MRLKDSSVNVIGLRPEMLLAIMICKEVYAEERTELVITSINDGVHSLTSLHYSGCAIDLRTRNFKSKAHAKNVADKINDRLTIDYDVVAEADHIHLEYQPRRR